MEHIVATGSEGDGVSYTSLLIVALVCSFCAVGCLAVAGRWLIWERFRQLSKRAESSSRRALNELFIAALTPRDVLLLTAAGVFAAGLLVWMLSANPLLSVAAGVAVLFAPGLIFSRLRRRRRQRLEEQLPLVLDRLASATRAGLNLLQALEDTGESTPAPISQEIGLIVRDYRTGRPIDAAIAAARDRLCSPSFNLIAAALMVNHARGGNLPETLTTMAASLREIWRLQQKLDTASIEGRKAVRVISIVPVGIFLLISLTEPGLIDTLVSSPLGWMFVTAAALLYGAALSWLRRVLAVDA